MRGTLATLFGAALAWLAAGAALADPAHDFTAARRELAPHFDDAGFLDDKPETPALLKRFWLAAEAVAAASATRPARITTSLKTLDKDINVHVVALDGRTHLVGLEAGDVGAVFIVADAGVVWRIGDTHSVATADLRPLLTWSEPEPQVDCSAAHRDDNWAECDRISPMALGRLPDGPGAIHRFWVDGRYSQAAGETEEAQLSFWSWDGARMAPTMLRLYQFHIELDGPPQLTGDILSVPVKDDFNSFDSCGACDGRQRVWRFEATAAGVRDLGKVSKVPELDLVDELYDRALRHVPLAPLVGPATARAIEASAAAAAPITGRGSLGMSDGWALSADRRRLCFSTDGGGAMLFTLAHIRSGLVVTSARRLGDDSCGDLVHWAGATTGS